MSYLIDTNVLLRSRDAASPHRIDCERAVKALVESDEDVFTCTQVLAEYWVVATRPREVNGMGLSIADASVEIDKIVNAFDSLAEPVDGPLRWRDVVVRHAVMGKPAHDARLGALMLAHGVTHILTLNPSDFARYSEITTITPAESLSR